MEKTVGWCCLLCNINFYLPENAVDINEFCVHCPLCGEIEHTLMNTLTSSDAFKKLSEQFNTGLELVSYQETFSESSSQIVEHHVETFTARALPKIVNKEKLIELLETERKFAVEVHEPKMSLGIAQAIKIVHDMKEGY